MSRRTTLLVAITQLPEEAFSWLVVWCLHGHGDGHGGFTPDARAAITQLQRAATDYLQAPPANPATCRHTFIENTACLKCGWTPAAYAKRCELARQAANWQPFIPVADGSTSVTRNPAPDPALLIEE